MSTGSDEFSAKFGRFSRKPMPLSLFPICKRCM
jgi:hypothetical protein